MGKETVRETLHRTEVNGKIDKIRAEHQNILDAIWPKGDSTVLYLPHVSGKRALYKRFTVNDSPLN